MQRVTISIDDDLSQDFDRLTHEQGYTSKSEAIRDLIRTAVAARPNLPVEGACVASLSYVYDHHVRALAQRLIELQHDHHDIVVATTHIHLNHDSCLETVILKGPAGAVRALADAIQSQRGVRFATLNVIGVTAVHSHDHGHHHA
ncbi:ribbon-helix-helix protein, copG family protein [Asticcacaulis biprosthecium C19]|uniref:Putative nickel-responsive regulator n=1 Tax=Asticcacaulis biprosthecium C19 TaxID=715226 RepID=F4QTV7_9CAUL|nr:nickel-responsive transcriptional regulator NikR [Asticcacaulis biprosthecium]EGF89257.1 ribbon-helix-helix protein, copG family protein [Asticcacaulis biprosthecium C19]